MSSNLRIPLSKKTRFDVFKRDSFSCQYCGASPPGSILEIDHIHPVSKGGKNSIDNLVTSCISCNRGKSDGLLSSVPESVAERAALVAEKIDQMKAYEKLLKANRRSEEKSINDVEVVFQMYFPSKSFNPKFRQSVRVFLNDIDAFKLMDYMHKACSKRPDNAEDSVKYFCGICWKVARGEKYGAR